MPYSVRDVQSVVEALWPAEGAESWDAVGLVSGDPDAPVASIVLAVDATVAVADFALTAQADLLLVHHPLLLRGVTTIAEDRFKGALLGRLIRGGCALLAAHTNADTVPTGTSAAFADALGLLGTTPIVPNADGVSGLGRTGRLVPPLPLDEVARRIAAFLPATATGIRVAGDPDQLIGTVSVCAGAGDSLLGEPAVLGSDLYVTSDLRHHPASEAREQAMLGRGTPALIDVSHWAAESLWLAVAAAQLEEALPGIACTISIIRTDPWDFVVSS